MPLITPTTVLRHMAVLRSSPLPQHLWSTMECSQPVAWTSNRILLEASRVKAISRRPTNQARAYSELCTWKAVDFSVTGVVSPAQHLHLLLLRAEDIEQNPGPMLSGCSKSIRCDTTPILCSTCQRHFHITSSHLTQSQKSFQGFICSVGAAALPPTATITSNSVLPRRCLICHTKIRHGIRLTMCQQCSHL